jgi:hypothetical protein
MKLRKKEEVAELPVTTNAAVDLLRSGTQYGRYALAFVDSVEVIERHRFIDVAQEAAQWADLLRRLGLEPGWRVIVLGGRDRHWRSALLGVLEAGGVAVPCPASTPVEDLRFLAVEGRAVAVVSASPRPELVEALGMPVLWPGHLDARQRRDRVAPLGHRGTPHDFGLILYARNSAGFRGEAHTHESLLDQASIAAHALGLRQGDTIWSTVPDGSPESLWLTLAAWQLGVEVVVVEPELAPHTKLELLHRLRAGAVWFSDDEYAALATAQVQKWVDLTAIRVALTTGEPAAGATAFRAAFDVRAAQAGDAAETAAVAAAPAPVPQIVPAPPTPALRHPERANAKNEDELLRRRAQREAAEQRRRRDEEKRREQERVRAEKEARRREEQQAKERQKEDERRRKEEAARDELAAKAARAEEQRRAEDEKRSEEERIHAEREARRREEQQAKERQKEDERRRKEQAARDELAARAARAEEQRRAEQEKRRAAEEQRRLREEANNRELAKREAEAARRRAKEAEKARLAAALADTKPEHLPTAVLSRLDQYGMPTADPDAARDDAADAPRGPERVAAAAARRATTTPRASAPATGQGAAGPPRARTTVDSRPRRVPLLTAVATALLALGGRLAVWRLFLPRRSRQGFETGFAEIAIQVLVAILVSVVVGWLIGTLLPR